MSKHRAILLSHHKNLDSRASIHKRVWPGFRLKYLFKCIKYKPKPRLSQFVNTGPKVKIPRNLRGFMFYSPAQ